MTGQTTTVGIAGAGLLGRVLAWRLQQYGFSVTLFDRDLIYPGRGDYGYGTGGSAAAYTAAGMLAPMSELESAEGAIYQLGKRGLELWPSWLEQLGGEHLYRHDGTLVVAHSQDRPYLDHFRQTLTAKLTVDESDQFQVLNQKQIAELEPELATQFGEALLLKSEAWVQTFELMALLAEAILAAGARWFEQSMVEHIAGKSIYANGQQHPFDWVIDCRGLGAKADINGLRGVRGEVIEVLAPEVTLKHMVRLMHPRYRLYLVPRPNNHFILGATQIESEDMSNISVRSALELLSALYAIHPGFAEARIVDTRTNCRPAMSDNLPVIETSAGLIKANGLYRHGYLLAPAVAEQVVAIITNELDRVPKFSEIHRCV